MEEPSKLKRALIDSSAGAISGGISRTVTSPLDVIKIRFQVQLEPTSSWALLRKDLAAAASAPSKYTGMFQATKDILREEGVQGFWRGNVPALLMVMPYTAIQFTVLHKLKTFVSGSSKTENHINLSPYLSYVSGALAGCAATVGSYPFDLLRTILASQGEPKAWNHRYSNSAVEDNLSSFQLFFCGLAAGTCAKLVCHPLDVVKKRFQIEGLQRHPRYGARVEHRAYRNMFDAMQRIMRLEGWAGLYKGIIPSTVKAAPAGAVTFVAYELTSDWLESTFS